MCTSTAGLQNIFGPINYSTTNTRPGGRRKRHRRFIDPSLIREKQMAKFVLAGLVFVFMASIGIRPADAQDIQGRWIHTENSQEWLTTRIDTIGNGIIRIQFLGKNLRLGRAVQSTCVGRYRYDGRNIYTSFSSTCQACERGVCAPMPQQYANGACAIQWQDRNSFVNCAGQAFHRY